MLEFRKNPKSKIKVLQFFKIQLLNFWKSNFWNSENSKFDRFWKINFWNQLFDFQHLWFSGFRILRFQNISEIYPTLNPHNFFAIRPILIILDVPESFGPLLSRSHVYFPGRFHESSPKRWIKFRNYRFSCFLAWIPWNVPESENLDRRPGPARPIATILAAYSLLWSAIKLRTGQTL